MKTDFFQNAATAVLTVCAVLVTGLVARRELFPPSAPGPAVAEPVPVKDWTRLTAGGSLLGPPGAPVKIVEFSDFQCPFCAGVRTQLDSLRARFPGRVAVVYRHLPLTAIHPHALAAATASECAAAQDRFQPFHDALFNDQGSIGTRPWRDYARASGVPDLAKFDACVHGAETAGRVRGDMREAQALGIRGTPAFIFDGKLVMGAPGAARIEGWIDERLHAGRGAATGGR